MKEYGWIYAELVLWLMRLTDTPPHRQPGATYAAIEDELARLAALPPGFRLPDIRGVREHVQTAQRRYSGQSPDIPSIPGYAYCLPYQTSKAIGRLLAAGIAAAGIDHTVPLSDILAATKQSMEAHGCADITDVDMYGWGDVGEVFGRDFED